MNYILRRNKLGKATCEELSQRLVSPIKVITTDNPVPNTDGWIFRWGTTAGVPTKKVVNGSEAIAWAANKQVSRMDMQNKGVPVPRSYSISVGAKLPRELPTGKMFVGRKPTHVQGQYLASGSYNYCFNKLAKWGVGGYISEFIDKVTEYRVFVFLGRVLWVAQKTPGNPKDIAWNVAKGGHFANVTWADWPISPIEACVQAMNVGGLDFGGVDVMVDAAHNVYILEINCGPLLESEYRQQCVARGFDWVIGRDTKETLEPYNRRTDYRRWIHPCLYSNR